MRFYKKQHQFYIGIDLHARTMYICVINNIGETVFHKNMECSRDNLELVTNTFGKDIVVGTAWKFRIRFRTASSTQSRVSDSSSRLRFSTRLMTFNAFLMSVSSSLTAGL